MTSAQEQSLNFIRGLWVVEVPEACDGGLLLKKREAAAEPGFQSFMGDGDFLEFQEDGRLIDTYSAECGMDPHLHRWSGKWMLDSDQSILSMRIDNVEFSGFMRNQPSNPSQDYLNGRQYRIIALTDHEMLLERVQSHV